MDFDEIADKQQWNDLEVIGLLREFISKVGMQDELNTFAQERADEEADVPVIHEEEAPSPLDGTVELEPE